MPKFILLLIATLVIGGYFFISNKTTNTSNASLTIQVQKVQEQNKLYQVSAEYPQFSGAPNEFNKNIENYMQQSIAEYKKTVSENWQMRKANDSKLGEFPDQLWSYTGTWIPTQLNNKYISFLIKVDSFNGGANLNQDMKSFNYDLANKKEVSLTDLFGANYLSIISKFATADLLSQFEARCKEQACIPTEMIKMGASAQVENFNKFTFNDNVVTFYFLKAQVAPGAEGEQSVIVPRDLK